MKRRVGLVLSIILLVVGQTFAQYAYYDKTKGKTGKELKALLHQIIKSHKTYTYTDLWTLIRETDEDPKNPNNIIMIYDGRSRNKNNTDKGDAFDYASKGYTINDSWNREHIWAKSHGDFNTIPPAGTDLHHIRPADRNVNERRSEKDFDIGGTPDPEAVDCKTDADSWEPRDQDKGDIARMMFYMAVRYEGEVSGEPDLELVDRLTAYPYPEFGVLSVLLKWNEQDPPDAFEIRRNEFIYRYQQNRNPFIDHPEFANMIWKSAPAKDIFISNVVVKPDVPTATDPVTIKVKLTNPATVQPSVSITWGTDFYKITNVLAMTKVDTAYTVTIPAQAEGVTVYFKISAKAGDQEASSQVMLYNVPKIFTGTLVPIKNVQGQTNASPYQNKTVSIKGIVTGVFGSNFYIQDATGPWNGIYVYNSKTIPEEGDELIITGLITEYYELTEMSDLTYYSLLSKNNPLPAPVVLKSGDLSNTNALAEQYESVYVRILNVTCNTGVLAYGLWKVNDGSGDCNIHNPVGFDFKPVIGTAYDITGIENYTFSERKIDIRYIEDVEAAADFTPPYIKEYTIVDQTNITIYFSEDVEQTTAENIANYVFNHNITVQAAKQHAFQKNRVNLTLKGLTNGTHTLTVNSIKDLAGNIAKNATKDILVSLTAITELPKDNFRIFPNPCKSNLYISTNLTSEKILKFQLYDIYGQCIYDFQEFKAGNGENTLSLDVSTIEKGIYFVKVWINRDLYIEKIIIK